MITYGVLIARRHAIVVKSVGSSMENLEAKSENRKESIQEKMVRPTLPQVSKMKEQPRSRVVLTKKRSRG